MKNSFWLKLVLSGVMVCALFAASMSFSYAEAPELPASASAIGRNTMTLIIDPGHGGADGGAVSITGTFESKINLDISLKIEQLAGFYGVLPIMTRSSEEIEYPEDATTIRSKKVADQKARVALINSADNAVLISIHQNKYTSSGPSGSQVFYAGTERSEDFGNYIQQLLLSEISSSNRRTASKIPDNIFLMKSIDCTAILVECGFVSNPTEAYLLEDSSYQTKLAAVIFGGYLGFIS